MRLSLFQGVCQVEQLVRELLWKDSIQNAENVKTICKRGYSELFTSKNGHKSNYPVKLEKLSMHRNQCPLNMGPWKIGKRKLIKKERTWGRIEGKKRVKNTTMPIRWENAILVTLFPPG